MIIGVVYTLAIGKFQNLGQKEETVTLKNLKQYLKIFPKLNGIDSYEKVRFLCLDNCSSCDILIDGDKMSKEGSFNNFIDNSLSVYKYDYASGLTSVTQQKVYFNVEGVEETVCFSYEMNNQGVGDQIVLEYKDGVYDFTTYLEKTARYSSTVDFIEAKEKLIEEVIR